MLPVRIAAASLLFVLIGRGARRGAGEGLHESPAGRLALDGTIGLALATPCFFFLSLLGWPVNAPGVVAACGFLAVLLAVVPPRRPHPVEKAPDMPPVAWFPLAVLLAALALFAWKVWQTPLWSWDHYAVWGVKARRLVSDGQLDLSFLQLASLRDSVPDYPLGLPLAWRLLSLGSLPAAAAVKCSHVLFGFALVALVREAALEAAAGETAANLLGAFTAVTPLFWDTESLGLADMPLALAASAAFHLLSRFRGGSRWWLAGAMFGFLPWIKGREGLTLGILAALAGGFLARGMGDSPARRAGKLLLPFSIGAAMAIASCARLPRGVPFLAGDWKSRGIARIHEAPRLLGMMARELLRADWLGFWVLFAAATAAARLLRRRSALLLSAVVWAQLAIYSAVYFVTYLDPGAHIGSSFFRISAALVPLGVIAAGSLLSRRESV